MWEKLSRSSILSLCVDLCNPFMIVSNPKYDWYIVKNFRFILYLYHAPLTDHGGKVGKALLGQLTKCEKEKAWNRIATLSRPIIPYLRA